MCTLFPLLRGLEIQLEGRGLFLCISRGVFWRKKLQNPKVGVLLEAESKGGFTFYRKIFGVGVQIAWRTGVRLWSLA